LIEAAGGRAAYVPVDVRHWEEVDRAYKEAVAAVGALGIVVIAAGILGGYGQGQGYGATSVDPLALAYYRYARAMNGIGENGEQVFNRPDLGTETRHEAVDRSLLLFEPGYIVTKAFASGDGLV